jgi:hypothetical protein
MHELEQTGRRCRPRSARPASRSTTRRRTKSAKLARRRKPKTPPRRRSRGATTRTSTPRRRGSSSEPPRRRRQVRRRRARRARDEGQGARGRVEVRQEKLEERAAQAEQKAEAATREAARLRIALKKGLTETQAKRLVGDTEEELEKDADELLKSFKDDEGGGDDGGTRRTPKPRLRTGAAPSSEPDETDPEKLAEQVPRR